jgi:hypothetical protein
MDALIRTSRGPDIGGSVVSSRTSLYFRFGDRNVREVGARGPGAGASLEVPFCALTVHSLTNARQTTN